MENEKVLEVDNLHVSFQTYAGEVKAVRGVSFELKKGETLAFVGESGCGKTVTAKAVMRLLKPPFAEIKPESKIVCNGKDVMKMTDKELYKFRGDEISMIFQDPMTSLNPTMTIGKQIMESLIIHRDMNKAEARKEAIRMLEMVKIPSPESRIDNYPHELSGGMRQRVMIAIALACNPKILIADEPTTALDVTIQAQILELMQDLQKKLGMAIIMVTHDLGVIASMCDEILVMYGGRVCERGTADDIFYRPAHEYTKGLLRSIPRKDRMGERLVPIGGTPINLLNMPEGCAFCPRCDAAMKVCLNEIPQEIRLSDTHLASCWMNIKEMYEAQEEN